jgi:hypothetical protein
VGTAAGGIASRPHVEADRQGMRGAMTVRDLWAQLKESVGTTLDRVHPSVLIVTGLAAVVIAFGALGLAMLDDGSGLGDLGLDAPPDRAEEGDAASGTGGGTGVGSDSLSEGLTTRGPGAGSTDDGPAGADGTGENGMADPGAPSPAAAGDSPGTAAPTTGPTTTSASVPRTTAPATTATTAGPPSTPSTTEPPHGSGVIGGLLDLLVPG